jgi:hypothetical protein
MEINEGHRKALIALGIKEEDFRLFDGKTLTYEFDERRGVRLYDPYYHTSYTEYIDVDGWSSWSAEQDPPRSFTKRRRKRNAGRS